MNNHKIAIIIPSTVNANEGAPSEIVAKWIKVSKVKFAKFFGGFTAHHAKGGWVSDEHGLIEEDVTVVVSFTNDDGLIHLDAIREFASDLASEMGQEAIAIEVDNSMEFVASMAYA